MNNNTKILIGLVVAVLGYYAYKKYQTNKLDSDAIKERDSLNNSIKNLLTKTDWSKQKSQYSDFDLVLKKLSNTIDANIMSTDELKKVNNQLLAYNNQYVGTG
jgi:hypothetical protein